MLSVRSFARHAPRAVTRMTAASFRQSASRPSIFAKTSTLNAFQPVSRSTAAYFSTTLFRRDTTGETDDELSAKLEREITAEGEMVAQQPATVKDYLDNSSFDLIDVPGQEMVKLQRTFGDEKITVSFSIADIANYDPYSEDPALEDEEDLPEDMQAMQNPNKQANVPATGGARSARAAEEHQAAIDDDNADDEDLDDPLDDAPAPISLSIVIEKPGKAKGALHVDATAQDGNIVVENMFFYEDAGLATDNTADGAHRRADHYPGPPFGTLDEDLQVLMERYLEERGVTQAMAVFVPDYVDIKEQREYQTWLTNVKAFIDA